MDLLKSINEKAKCVVQITLTTYDEEMCRILEPGVSTTKERFQVLEIMRENGIPTVVWMTPILPFINDTKENLKGILDYCNFPGLWEKYHKKYGYAYEVNSDKNEELMDLFTEVCRKG